MGAILTSSVREAKVTDSKGNEVTIWCRPVTRLVFRNAINEAAHAFIRKHGKNREGFDYGVFEKEIVKYAITKWSITEYSPADGWEYLDHEIGDNIAKEAGIDGLLDEVTKTKETETAKN